MSFWFAKKAKAPKRSAGATGKPSGPKGTQQQAEVLQRLGCPGCPLHKGGIKQAPSLAQNTQVYFLGEAEDETGEINSILRYCIPDDSSSLCSFDNVINCKSPKTPSFTEIECCRPRRANFIGTAKPRIIVGLGTVPLQAMLGSTDMAGLRGRLFAVKIGEHSCWFLPTYHPDWIAKFAYDKKKPLQSRLGHCFRMDIQKAFDLVEGLEPPKIITEAEVKSNIITFDGNTGFDRLLNLLSNAKQASIKSVDIETKGLRPYSKDAAIMTCAISFGTTNFAFALNHPKSGWSKAQCGALTSVLLQVLADDTVKIAHNAPFEIEWFIWLLGKGMVNHTAWECTMMQAHFLDERKGKYKESDSKANRYQGLDFLVKQHFGVKFKGLFKLNKKDMSKSDLGETLIYNAADAKLTLMLYHRQFQLLKAEKLLSAYRESAPRQPTVALMQSFGVPVSQKAVKAAQAKLGPEVKRLEDEINGLKVVQAYIADHKEFNWQSNKDVPRIFQDYLKCSEITIKDASGASRVSVDKNVLAQIDHPLAQKLIDLREVAKLKSTYVDAMEIGAEKAVIFPDGNLHPSFNTTATETGRTSADEPSIQNYPKRKNVWIRKQVAARKGELLVAVDYGALEACTGAMCSKDKFLVKALWEDYDIHAEWAQKFAYAAPGLISGKANLKDKAVMKGFRSLIKNKMVFPAFFGATNESVHGYLVNATNYEVEQSIVDNLMNEFWTSFSGMANWQKSTMKGYYDKGYVATLQGRKHRYPLTKNQAVNMPIQGTAAELVCDAMCRLSYMALSTNQLHLHPILNIHDDLTFFIPDDDKVLEDSLNIITREMLVFDFPWINVPLSIEISIGSNWCDVVPIEKVWSHKAHGYPHK